MALDDRKKAILRAIVENYITNAEPVGSRSIAKSTNLNLSAATIRKKWVTLRISDTLFSHIRPPDVFRREWAFGSMSIRLWINI